MNVISHIDIGGRVRSSKIKIIIFLGVLVTGQNCSFLKANEPSKNVMAATEPTNSNQPTDRAPSASTEEPKTESIPTPTPTPTPPTIITAYSRWVEQLTGKPGHPAGIKGQDTPRLYENAGRIYFLFGDTLFNDDQFFHPNSLAATADFDAGDGISDLTYYRNNRHIPALNRFPGEFSLWFNGAYALNGKVYGKYHRVITAKPLVMGNLGFAVQNYPSSNFQTLGIELPPTDPRYDYVGGTPFVNPDGYVYHFSRIVTYLESKVYLARVPVTKHLDINSFEYLTDSGWSKTFTLPLKVVMSNANTPSAFWNNYFQKWIAISNRIYGPDKQFVDVITARFADKMDGPWSEPLEIVNPKEIWGTEDSQTYNAFHHSKFDKEDGRVIYSFSTRDSTYNVNIFETQFGYAKSPFKLAAINGDLAAHHTLGLKLTGSSFENGKTVDGAKLILPLKTPNTALTHMVLRISVGTPNHPQGFNGPLLPITKKVEFDLPAFSNQIEIKGAKLKKILNAVYSDSNWKPEGTANTIYLLIKNVESGDYTPNIGNSPILGICHGQPTCGF